MRYFINFDKSVNQLVPYYLGGRKLILYLQALISPLRRLNDAFVGWAKETRIEATMTSQPIKFEWYLNHKFSKYFLDGGRITFMVSEGIGTPIYHEDANITEDKHDVIYHQSETKEGDRKTILYRSDYYTDESSVGFVVVLPAINERLITREKFLPMLVNVIEKYRLANKTYVIK